jgi:hypothetical protein
MQGVDFIAEPSVQATIVGKISAISAAVAAKNVTRRLMPRSLLSVLTTLLKDSVVQFDGFLRDALHLENECSATSLVAW